MRIFIGTTLPYTSTHMFQYSKYGHGYARTLLLSYNFFHNCYINLIKMY